jgi:flagellin
MSITFNTNISALGTQRYLGIASDNTSSSLAKLSSGSRVPTAKDDAAALAVGTQLKAEVAGLQQASLNASQASSVLQIADGALSTTSDILTRMKTLAIQASSGQLSDSDRSLLNQEYTSLQAEVDRIANITNFNGKTLLSGSTSVNQLANNLAAYAGNNTNTTATNLITANNGLQSVDFADTFNGGSTGAVSLAYDHTTNNLTVTNLVSGAKQSINIGSTSIATGSTATYNFSSLGLSVTLNDQFDKAADLAGTNTATSTGATPGTAYTLTASPAGLGLTGGTSLVFSISAASFTGTGAGQFDGSQLAGASIAISGAVGTVTYGNVTIGTHTFSATSGTVNLGSAGTKTTTYSDGQGNSFTVSTVVTGSYTGTAAGSVAIAAGTTGGLIESDAANRPQVLSVAESATVANQYNFGNLDNAQVAVDATTATAATASITVSDGNGGTVTFNSAGTGGTTADLTSTGAKTITLADANGNKITLGFTVTKAFANGDTARINLASLGQVVAANAQTVGSTSFSFKVGTGTSSNDSVSFTLDSATQAALGINGTSIETATNADTAITAVTAAITTVSSNRAAIGASESRLSFAKSSVDVAVQNTTAAESGLLDVDVSSEITKFSSQQVLLQAGVSLLAQANQQPALLLKLLQ